MEATQAYVYERQSQIKCKKFVLLHNVLTLAELKWGAVELPKILDGKRNAFSNQVPLSDPRQLVRKSLSPT